METPKWRSYAELAWTEPIITPPENYVEETDLLAELVKGHSKIAVRKVLHLGCGAGGNDYVFKRHFDVTGVDIAEGMLEIAKQLNPEVTYRHGDMRTIELGESFDAVVIPDSIGHLTTVEDLRAAIMTSRNHLNPGGVLLITANLANDFTANNFVYTGSRGDIEITVFENNYIPDPAGTTYEATFVYLIRNKGELEIHTDHGSIGLFRLEKWLNLFKEEGLDVAKIQLERSYDRFIAGEGKYLQHIFVCNKLL
ncbi:MAG: class I SAM-dependent methyltransferase [Actinomycetota bacterium]|nr:class I SAM-dependent methyltransferase [Actinomycetota bacterium]